MPNKVLFGPEKIATTSTPGLLKASGSGSGLQLDSSGYLKLSYPGASTIKAGSNLYAPVVVGIQHESVFYGLAKAAGDSTQAASSNAVGTYTDNAKTAIQNMLSVAPTNSPVFTESISLGRFYDNNNSSSEYNTIGTNSIAVGDACAAVGDYSQAFGINILAKGNMSFGIGNANVIYGNESFSGGWGCTTNGEDQFVFGTFNYSDSWDNIPTWTPNTTYHVGDRVKYDMPNNNTTTRYQFLCMSENTDETFNSAHWFSEYRKMKYVEIIGNGHPGVQNVIRSNARALDWDGNEYLKGDLYIGCNADSTGGTKLVGLPAVTSNDDGKVLRVIDGQWTVAAAPGGSGSVASANGVSF